MPALRRWGIKINPAQSTLNLSPNRHRETQSSVRRIQFIYGKNMKNNNSEVLKQKKGSRDKKDSATDCSSVVVSLYVVLSRLTLTRRLGQ